MIKKIKKNIDQQKRKSVMIRESVHDKLFDYCQVNGLIIGRTVDKIIVDYLSRNGGAGVDV